jgi:hypothetical protein
MPANWDAAVRALRISVERAFFVFVVGDRCELMRLSRERRKDGMRVVPIEVQDAEIDGLVACGFLAAADRANRDSIARALGMLLDRLPPTRWQGLVGRGGSASTHGAAYSS